MLSRQLCQTDWASKTWAQRWGEVCLGEVLERKLRALHENLARIDGKIVPRDLSAGLAQPLPQIDELMARKILEAFRDKCDDPPAD
jgi:hypothetical protein